MRRVGDKRQPSNPPWSSNPAHTHNAPIDRDGSMQSSASRIFGPIKYVERACISCVNKRRLIVRVRVSQYSTEEPRADPAASSSMQRHAHRPPAREQASRRAARRQGWGSRESAFEASHKPRPGRWRLPTKPVRIRYSGSCETTPGAGLLGKSGQ